MALKAILDTLDGINSAIAAEYTKGEDGKFYLQAEGMILKAKFDGKLEESNKKNSALSQEIAQLRALAETRVEKAEVEKLQAELNAIENGKGEKFQKVLEEKIAAFRATAEASLSKYKGESEKATAEALKAKAELKNFRIDQEVQAVASGLGLRGKNAPQYLALARKDFDLDEATGKVIAVKRSAGPDGKEVVTPIQGEDWEPVKLQDFIAKQHRTEAFDVFFDGGSGTGAPGQTKPVAGKGVYLTREQAQNPQVYQQAKEAAVKAGVPLQIQPDTKGF